MQLLSLLFKAACSCSFDFRPPSLAASSGFEAPVYTRHTSNPVTRSLYLLLATRARTGSTRGCLLRQLAPPGRMDYDLVLLRLVFARIVNRHPELVVRCDPLAPPIEYRHMHTRIWEAMVVGFTQCQKHDKKLDEATHRCS